MIRAAGAAAAVLLLAGCMHAPPRSSWIQAAGPVEGRESAFLASFSASARTPEGAIRLRGHLAVSSRGRLRVEVPGPAASVRFFLVAGDGSITAILGSQQVHYADSSDARLLRHLFGLDLDVGEAAALIGGEPESPGESCRPSAVRWGRFPGGDLRVPRKILLECGGSRLRLRLSDHEEIPAADVGRLFAPLRAPPGYQEVDLAGLGDRIRSLRPD